MGACASKPATTDDQAPVPASEAAKAPPNGGIASAAKPAAAPTTTPAADGKPQAAEPAAAAAEPGGKVKEVDLAVVDGGMVVLQNSVGKTNFKGLADFEDAERQEANKSILACFGCNPKVGNTEHRFDNITNLLAGIFSMPVALVVFLDSAWAYIKAGVGMSQAEGATSRGLSFCTWTLVTLKPEVQVIADTLKDGRFKTHPYVVGLPHIRFYAGAPLISSRGHRLGSLCLCDYTPRTFDAECCNILCNFAEIVVRDTERYAAEDGVAIGSAMSTGGGGVIRELGSGDGITTVALVSTGESGWPMLFVSEGFAEATGIGLDATGKPFWELFYEPGGNPQPPGAASEAFAERVRHGASFIVEVAGGGIGSDTACLVRFRPAALENLDHNQVHININIPGPVRKAVDQNPSAYYFATVQRVSRISGGSTGSIATHDPQEEVPFDDVRLGGLLGKGSFGSVYIGIVSGTPCAVKVIEHRNAPDQSATSAKEELEATLGMEMDHPHIVRTMKFATRERRGSTSVRSRQLPGSSAASSNAPTPMHSGGSGIARTGGGGIGGGGGDGSRLSVDLGWEPRKGRMETWIVLELCDLGSLQAAIDEGFFRQSGNIFEGAPDVSRILTIATQIASAMDYLHARGLLHSDLTANNILLQSVGGLPLDLTAAFEASELALTPAAGGGDPAAASFVAKVSDFGLSRAAATESAMSTNTIGTVTHMPPELLRDGQLSKAVDVYAFGVLMWEMYVGERPWAGMRPVTIILKKTQHKARLAWPPGTPAAYQELADACMSTDPKGRPTFSQILQKLEALQQAAASDNLAPSNGFSQYHGWQRAFEGNAAREEAG